MSGDLSSVQTQMVTNEFLDRIKSLSDSSSSNTYAVSIEQLHRQLKRATPNGFKENKPFVFCIVDNFYHLVPIFDTILSNNDEKNEDFIQTKNILETLSNSLNEFCLFDLFTIMLETRKLQTIFDNSIGLLKEIYFTADKYIDLLNCILPIIVYSSIFVAIQEDDIPSGLLTYSLTYAKQHWHNAEYERLVRNILSLLKVFSKKPALIPMIIRTDWPNTCIQWLATTGTRPLFNIDYYIHLILQKLARHTIAVQALNQLNCLKALDQSKEQMKKDHTESENDLLDFLHSMIYVLLMEANDIKQISLLADQRMCQALDKLVLYTIQASRNELFCYQCFHICEMMDVLSKLFVNDVILIKCIDGNNQLFDCLCQLIIHFTDVNRIKLPLAKETLLTSINLLWSISFHQSYQEKFRSNSMFMHSLYNVAASSCLYTSTTTKSNARDICSLKKAAEGILWNLNSSSSPSVAKISNENSEKQQPLAMISYSHSDSTFCRELVERLSAHVPVWVDYKQAHDAIAHSDDLWEEIARAMEMATVIVLIISKEYYDSKSCRQELSYATDALKKRIVPIYAPNQQYRASGWLGIRIAGQKYIHFGRKLFPEAVKELASMVVTDQKQQLVITAPAPSSSPSPPMPEENPKLAILKDWTSKDIGKWFEDNHIHGDLIALYADQFQTGTSLVIYARHLKLFYRHEFVQIVTKYHKLFPEKTLDTLDFITLVDAFYRLRAEYDPHCTIDDSLEKSNEQRLPQPMNKLDEGMTWL